MLTDSQSRIEQLERELVLKTESFKNMQSESYEEYKQTIAQLKQ